MLAGNWKTSRMVGALPRPGRPPPINRRTDQNSPARPAVFPQVGRRGGTGAELQAAPVPGARRRIRRDRWGSSADAVFGAAGRPTRIRTVRSPRRDQLTDEAGRH